MGPHQLGEWAVLETQSASLQPLPFLLVSGPGDAVELGMYFCALGDEAIKLVQKTTYFKGRTQASPQYFCSQGTSRSPELASLGFELCICWRFPQPSLVGRWVPLAWLSFSPGDSGTGRGQAVRAAIIVSPLQIRVRREQWGGFRAFHPPRQAAGCYLPRRRGRSARL